MAKCKHAHGGWWGSWFYMEGPRSGIMMRIKYCNDCGEQMANEVKSV